MADIQYRPLCYRCRADAGKEPAGVKPDELCPGHLEAFALPLLDETPATFDDAVEKLANSEAVVMQRDGKTIAMFDVPYVLKNKGDVALLAELLKRLNP